MLILACACKKGEDQMVIVPQRHWVDRTVAVVAPIGDKAAETRLKRTAQWFLDNFTEAQRVDTLAVRMNLEWFDESVSNLDELAATLSGRDDVAAIIGPFGDDAVDIFARQCQRTQKPLIAPTASSEEIIRRYSVKKQGIGSITSPFLWALTETDVRLVEALFSDFATDYQISPETRPSTIAMFASNTTYGKTFNYWAPFFAENDGLTMSRNMRYDGIDELKTQLSQYMDEAHKDEMDAFNTGTVVVVDSLSHIFEVARMRREWLDKVLPGLDVDDHWILYSGFFQPYFAISSISQDDIDALPSDDVKVLQGYVGFSPYADPSTGFELSYKERFGTPPTFDECKFYDALMLAGFAASHLAHQEGKAETNENFNKSVMAITDEEAVENSIIGAVWNTSSMQFYMSGLEQGTLMQLIGASGPIAFDRDTYSSSLATTYVFWTILGGKLVHSSYLGTTSGRTINAQAAWEYYFDKHRAETDFQRQVGDTTTFAYHELTDQYALLVQGSNGLNNYRHQADVLSMYQLLRNNGYDDDHIILILDKKLADQVGNVVRTSVGGKDLLGGSDGLPKATVDYDNADITPTDIIRIMLGQTSDKLPVVFPDDAGNNILFYWSGHGSNSNDGGRDAFVWRDTKSGFSPRMMQETAAEMLGGQHCRKMLIVAEPCYGENVIATVKGIQGVLAISGANGMEQTWAENFNCEIGSSGVYMCDRFTSNFVNCLTSDPGISYRDLYLYCAQHTLGSHVRIVNAEKFGNLYVSNISEFIIKK